MVKLAKMKVVPSGAAGTRPYVFRTNPLLYASIGTIVGIVPIVAADEKLPLSRIEDLILYNVLSNVNVSTGTAATNRKSAKLLCKSTSIEGAETELIGKTIPQGIIRSVSAGLNAEFRL